MGGQQVSWPDDVCYEELVKRCPFLSGKEHVTEHAEELDSNEVDTEVVPITKSKKRRLKKRLKTINLEKQDCPRVHNSALLLQQSSSSQETSKNMSSSSKIKTKKSTEMLGQGKSKLSSHPTSKMTDEVDGEMVSRSTSVNTIKIQDVVSEKELKKKSKQKKKESTEAQHDHKSKNESRSNNLNDAAHLPTEKTGKESSSEPRPSVEVVPAPQNSEKSREEIKAEREAKKKAKQLAKEKKKEISSDKSELLDTKVGQENETVSAKSEKIDTLQKPALPEKSKAELRTERRMKQEAQRAAKEAEKFKKSAPPETKGKKPDVDKIVEGLTLKTQQSLEIRKRSASKSMVSQRIKLFSHLQVGRKPSQTLILPNIHPAVLELGAKYSARIVNGSNARCIALLNALKKVIQDYVTPSEKEFSRGLESELGELTNYLNLCRPFSVSMTNALRHIKSHLTQLPNHISDEDARKKLCDVIDTFIREQIDVAGEAICEYVKKKITTGDVILIYSCSSLLTRILIESYRSGVDFSVVVVDGGPWFEGKEMLRRLVTSGLNCTYVQISALSFIMRQATKVLLGAHALLANGSVMSRAGSSLVALMANAYSVPVLVCCETYKFCERVQTDVFVYNELGSPDDLSKEDGRLSKWESLPCLSPLSLVYDITPPDLVTAVVTEIAILPCTSVPVILRVKPSDLI